MRTHHRSESRPVGVRMLLLTGLGLLVTAMGGADASAVAAARAVPIVDAARAEDASTVRTLLERQVDVNAAEADGTTALHWAAYQGDVETARLLLAAGARTDVTNRYGVTPLALAAGRGDPRVVGALLDAGADPNATLPEGETVLMAAARAGNVDALRLLLAHGADVTARESWRGQTALMWAAAQNHARATHTLIELGASVDERSNTGWSALLFAVRAGQARAVEALLTAGADVNDTVRPLSTGTAVAEPAGRPGGPEGTSALVIAVTNGYFSLAKYLVERGADPNAAEQGWTALHQLSYTRRPNSGKGMPPVPLIDGLGTLEFARFLLENGADPNLPQTRRFNNRERNNLNRVGATPYLLAAKHADAPLMQLLADHGADTRMSTEGNASPLMVAAGVGIFNLGESAGTNAEAFDAVQLAWELGDRSVLQADDRGYTALHGAALRGANPIVEFLVDRGADLLAESTEGWTPLRIADGVHYTGTVKRADHTAELLREAMREQGVYRPEHEKDVNSVAVVRPAGGQ